MWIHLLSLGLIDGAGGNVEPVMSDTHDGWWRKQHEKRKKRKQVEESPEVIAREIVQDVIVKAKKQPDFVPFDWTELESAKEQLRVIKQLAAVIKQQQDEKRRQEEDDEFQLFMLMA